jgi:RNA polymerase sigma-70 factor (ECF subfamily)
MAPLGFTWTAVLCSCNPNMAVECGSTKDERLRFERIALPYLDGVYTAALRLARNADDARDLLQETVLRAYQFFHQFTDGTNCRAWLLTILYNNFRNAYRRGTREQVATTIDEFERDVEMQSLQADQARYNPEQLFASRTVRREIEKALNALPEDFREALLLVDVHDLNYHEVSEILAVPLGTVKSRVSRGRALMRAALLPLAIVPGKTGS